MFFSAVAIAASLRGHDIGRSFGSVLGTKKIHIYRILELKKPKRFFFFLKQNPLVTDEETTTKNKALSQSYEELIEDQRASIEICSQGLLLS